MGSCWYVAYLEEGQEVLYVGAVAQSSAGGLLRQPVEVLGCGQDGSSPIGQQAQQLGLTAGQHRLEACHCPHCTCIQLEKITGRDRS